VVNLPTVVTVPRTSSVLCASFSLNDTLIVPAGAAVQVSVNVLRFIVQLKLNELAGSRSAVLKARARFCVFWPVKSVGVNAPMISTIVKLLKSEAILKDWKLMFAVVPLFVVLREALKLNDESGVGDSDRLANSPF